MKNLRTRVTMALLLVGVVATSTAAQPRPRAASGNVTGIELGLEGSVSGVRGGSLRWILTVHEVVGVSDLRPAARATARIVTSATPYDQSVSITTDAYGRGVIDLPIPSDAPSDFTASIEVSAQSRARRRFDLPIRVLPSRSIEFQLLRSAGVASRTVQLFGRVVHTETGRPVANESVLADVFAGNDRVIGQRLHLRSNAEGLFAATVSLTEAESHAEIQARAWLENDAEVTVQTLPVEVGAIRGRRLLVSAAPLQDLVQPRTATRVQVVVRSPDGTPVAHAHVTANWRNEQNEPVRAETDSFGRAELPYHAPDIRESYEDVQLMLTAARTGYEEGVGDTTIRIAQVDFATAIAAEGGSLPDALGGTVWARVVSLDGSPAPAGTPVRLTGPRLPEAGLDGQTDANGVAAFDVRLAPHVDGADDSCGGISSTQITVTAGRSTHASRAAHCLAVDPDATLRIRSSLAVAHSGDHVRIDIARAPSVRDVPIALATFTTNGSRTPWRALGALVVPPGANVAEIELPNDSQAAVLVRARPLIGTERMEVRGGVTTIWVTSSADAATTSLDSASGEVRVRVPAAPGVTYSALTLALPMEASRGTASTLQTAIAGYDIFASTHVSTGGLGDAFLRARLASITMLDADAPSVLRAGALVAVPALENPEEHGHLRDPFRARARFVGGRLALIYRAIESVVDAAVPGHIDEVAVRTGRTWDLNERLLEAVSHDDALGDGGATALGGDTFDIRSLQAIDRTLSYDNIGRRITRQRLFTLLLNLREYVRENNLDLRWAARGEPSEWLRAAAESPRQLADGWGRPFVLRRAASGHARFSAVEPAVGYELISGGPNGVVGDADDIWDPTARVLPADSLYARAVGEDALVARLHGVELARATVAEVATAYEIDAENPETFAAPSDNVGSDGELVHDSWLDVPPQLVRNEYALALVRTGVRGDLVASDLASLSSGVGSGRLALGDEPRTLRVYSVVAGSDGSLRLAETTGRTAATLLVDDTLPSRIRTQEPVTVDLRVTNVGTETLNLEAQAFEDAHVRIRPATPVSIRPQAVATMTFTVEGLRAGESTADVALVAGGRTLRHVRQLMHVDRGLHPLRRRASGFAGDRPFRATLSIPDSAVDPRGRVIVVDGSALADDPEVQQALADDPSLLAWFRAMHSETLSDALLADLYRAQQADGSMQGRSTVLSTAAAVVAWSASDAVDPRVAEARRRAEVALGNMVPTVNDVAHGRQVDTEELASLLAVLAAGGATDASGGDRTDLEGVAEAIANLRQILRGELRRNPGNPCALAFASSALLLLQPDDVHARAMYEVAKSSVVESVGGLMLPRQVDDANSQQNRAATLALALAAHSVEDDAFAQRLLGGAFAFQSEVARAGGAPLLWMLAHSAYGSFGIRGASHALLSIDGGTQELVFEHGRAVVDLPNSTPGSEHTIEVSRGDGGSVAARVESSFGVPFTTRQGSIDLAMNGVVGMVGSRSALELTVTTHAPNTRMILDIRLPAAARADESLLAALKQVQGVTAVSLRDPGFMRVEFTPQALGEAMRLPLAVEWRHAGHFAGFGVVAYPSDTPSDMSVLAPTQLEVASNSD